MIRRGSFLDIGRGYSLSPYEVIKTLFIESLTRGALNEKTVYEKKPDREVPEISNRSVLLYMILIIVALAICCTKEMVFYGFAHRDRKIASELLANNYNELSKRLQLAI